MVIGFDIIAKEIANKYPKLSNEDITDIIVDGIESESFIIDIISQVKLPNSQQLQTAELKSSRLPNKQNAKLRLKNNIGNAKFLKKIKQSYSFVVNSSDKNRVTLLSQSSNNISNNINTFDASIKTKLYGNNENNNTLHSQVSREQPNYDITQPQFDYSVSARASRGIGQSLANELDKLNSKINNGTSLSLPDIELLVFSSKLCPTDTDILGLIYDIVNADINLRKAIIGSDWLTELRTTEKSLASIISPNPTTRFSVNEEIKEFLRFIVIAEYERLHSQTADQFIDSGISYTEYISDTNSFALYADKIYLEMEYDT